MSEQRVVIANCLSYLKSMPNDSVDVCVTSPPYWALRDYGSEPVIWGNAECNHSFDEKGYCKCGAWKGQLGLEPSLFDYIDHLMMVFDEVKRVLKPTGACWVNLGDTYANPNNSDFPSKTLLQIPSRFAIAMTDRGWILRNEVIWQKANCMPTSVKDRLTVDFEKFYFFVKNPKYYYKQLLEPMKMPTAKARFGHQKIGNNNNTNSGKMYHADILQGRNARTTWIIDESDQVFKNTSKWGDDAKESRVRQGMNQNRGNGIVEKRYSLPTKDTFLAYIKAHAKAKELIEGTDISLTTAEHWFRSDDWFAYPTVEDWVKIRDRLADDSEIFRIVDAGLMEITYESDDILKNSDGEYRNARTTWVINPQASSLEHCAMFPKELIKKPIDACCPPGGVVLDPFCGSGTVLEYCWEKDIDAIGIEINPDYERFIKKRSGYGQQRLI